MKLRLLLFHLLIIGIGIELSAQGSFTGDLLVNTNIYHRDSLRGAANNPFYDDLKSSTNGWLSVGYSNWGFDFGLRFDMFNNSILFGGNAEANGIGLGAFHVRKRIDKFTIAGGYIYDQFGSGTTFRSYENRGLGVDNALIGIMGSYEVTDDITVKALTGKQKSIRQFLSEDNKFINVYDPTIMGINIDGNFKIGEKGFRIAPGGSFVNRTIDKQSMEQIVNIINDLPLEERFVPRYNVYAYSGYATMSYKGFSVYGEYAGKTRDAIKFFDENNSESLINANSGYVAYGSASYSQKGFGITVQAKKNKNFTLRTSPLETLNDGVINFLPPMAKQNSLRLLSRYNANTQEDDELGFMVDVIYSPKKGYVLSANYADIRNENQLLFREIYVDLEIKLRKKPWKLLAGIQMIDYNQKVYEFKGDMVNTFTPFAEFTWKFDRKKSIRIEAQYLMTERNRKLFFNNDAKEKQDLGDWIYGLVEFNIAPKFSFSASDMYNLSSEIHYYDFSGSYAHKSTTFSIGYAKQVEGIICTGGVCRPEPAFSGVKIGIQSSF